MFDRNKFEAAFNEAIDAIRNSEQITKRELRVLSRSILEAVHATGDIGFVNKLIDVLSPVNKRVFRLYAKEFTGFAFDDASLIFTKKSKKKYEACAKACTEFLADPNNNIWSWAERHIDVEKKAFNIDQITDAFKMWQQRAEKQGLTQKDVVRAVLKAGVEVDTIIELMGEMYDVDVNVEEEQGE